MIPPATALTNVSAAGRITHVRWRRRRHAFRASSFAGWARVDRRLANDEVPSRLPTGAARYSGPGCATLSSGLSGARQRPAALRVPAAPAGGGLCRRGRQRRHHGGCYVRASIARSSPMRSSRSESRSRRYLTTAPASTAQSSGDPVVVAGRAPSSSSDNVSTTRTARRRAPRSACCNSAAHELVDHRLVQLRSRAAEIRRREIQRRPRAQLHADLEWSDGDDRVRTDFQGSIRPDRAPIDEAAVGGPNVDIVEPAFSEEESSVVT